MKKIFSILFFLLGSFLLIAQQSAPNYDEAKIPVYSLPNPLVFNNGLTVNSKEDWKKRRKEIYQSFEKEIYGVAPEWKGQLKSTIISQEDDALDGLAKRKEVRLQLINNDRILEIIILIYLPQNYKNAPIFLGYNFNGNHTTSTETDIVITDTWVRNNEKIGTSDNRANENGRGKAVSRWPMKEIISRGFGVATLYYGEIDPDYDDGFKNGVHQLFDSSRDSSSWGSVATWAWGLSRVMDYFETANEINVDKVIVIGHSRLGKTALWAGASDPRFAMIISNNSGCMGAAISNRKIGETVERINSVFPHWFCDNLKNFNNKEELLPVDQHELIALIAPRPVYVASASEDLWADPKGEFLSCINASPVYELFGMKGFAKKEMPAFNESVMGDISYHIRNGKHDITSLDWKYYMDYATAYFNK